jgi:NADPH:quinone reductase-like Zn-dependent oxidoreductase
LARFHVRQHARSESISKACSFIRLVESGRLRLAIDRIYPRDDIVAALKYIDRRRARGKVIISVAPAESAEKSPPRVSGDAQRQ